MNSQDKEDLDRRCRDAVNGVLMESLKQGLDGEMYEKKPCSQCKKMVWINHLLFYFSPYERVCFECINKRLTDPYWREKI